MSMPRQNAAPKVPTLPRGDQVAVYSTYLDAQKAVEALSDKGFPVEQVTIVGTDLKMVERVTGRLTYSRVAAAGFASGAWFGLFVGLVMMVIGSGTTMGAVLVTVGIGAGFGLLFSVLSYSLTRGKRDFTSASQIVAMSYAVLCLRETAGQALHILREVNLAGASAPTAPAPGYAQPPVPPTAPAPQSHGQQAPTPAAQPAPTPSPIASQHLTETGEPRYGVRVVDGKPQIPGTAGGTAPGPTPSSPTPSDSAQGGSTQGTPAE